jgi:hypothetical protein
VRTAALTTPSPRSRAGAPGRRRRPRGDGWRAAAGHVDALVDGREPQVARGQPQPPPAAPADLAATRDPDDHLALGEVPVPVLEAGPLAPLELEPRVAARPVAVDEQQRAALAQPGGEPRRLSRCEAPRGSHGHHRDHVGERRGHREPLPAGIGHEREPLEVDAEPRRRLDAELGDARDRDPAAAPRRTRERGHEQRDRPLDLHDRAFAERAARQYRGERRMRRHRPRVEPGGLHAADARLQLLDALDPARRRCGRRRPGSGSGHRHHSMFEHMFDYGKSWRPGVHAPDRGSHGALVGLSAPATERSPATVAA